MSASTRGFHRLGLFLAAIPLVASILVVVYFLVTGYPWGHGVSVRDYLADLAYWELAPIYAVFVGIPVVVALAIYGVVRAIGWVIGGFAAGRVNEMASIKLPLAKSDDLFAAVQAELGPNRRALLIAIDGADGVGKSSLSSWLAWQLEMPAVQLDLYLIKDSKPLRWRKDDFARVISERIDQRKPIIVEGVLVLDALNEVGRCADFLIFVRGQGCRGLSTQIRDYNSRQQPEAKAQFALEGFDV